MDQASGTPALERLDVLVGEWAIEAGPPGGPPWPGAGRVTFEEKATDGSNWEADIDVTYRKVT